MGHVACAAALALCVSSYERRACADWISLSSNQAADPGYLTNSDRFFLWLTATGVAVPRIYAGVLAATNEPPADNTKRDLGFVLGGGFVGTAMAVYMPFADPGEPLFTYTLLSGMLWGMAGVGFGGAASSNPRVLWLGASVGYGAVALYRMGLSIAGYADYRSGAAAQIALGIIGAAGCLVDLRAAEGAEKYFAYTCGGVFGVATIHGIATVTKRDRPWPKKEPPGGAFVYPIPRFDKTGGGLALGGVF